MKKLVFAIILMLGAGVICNAQFHYGYHEHYTPDDYARANIRAMEDYQLDNIRFDEDALKQNPNVWNNYLKYTELQEKYSNKSKGYSIAFWAGFAAISLGGLAIGTSAGSDLGSSLGAGLILAGSTATLVEPTGF